MGSGRLGIVEFPIYSPKAIAGIGSLPSTVADRSIQIRLARRAPDEPVQRFRRRELEEAAGEIRDRLRSYLEPMVDELREARPEIPASLNDRAADGAEPLLAIADAAGAVWSRRAREAVIALAVDDDESLNLRLLRDIKEVFGDRDEMGTMELLAKLHALDGSPWQTFKHDGLTAHALQHMLRSFDILPKRPRSHSGNVRGLVRAQFADAWDRWLP